MKKQIDRCKVKFNMATLPLRDLRLRWRAFRLTMLIKQEASPEIDCCFQCCVQRTGSRWLLRVLSDERVFRYSGLALRPFPPLIDRVRRDSSRSLVFPKIAPRSIIGPLYYRFDDFEKIPKPDNYRAFFVIRDPRDVVVSYFFATRDSHRLNPQIFKRRYQLLSMSEQLGIEHMIEWLAEEGMFIAMEQWLEAQELDQNERIRVFRYEDLTGGNQASELRKLLEFTGSKISETAFEELTQKYSLKNMRGGKDGETLSGSHYRTGRAGDWMEHLDDVLLEKLLEKVGPRTRELYEIN